MADNVQTIAAKLGARVVGELPETGGGAFGAARLGRIVMELGGRAVVIPVRGATLEKLIRLADRASTPERKVDPVQVAVRLLEAAVAEAPEA